jgi:hypothetical protein
LCSQCCFVNDRSRQICIDGSPTGSAFLIHTTDIVYTGSTLLVSNMTPVFIRWLDSSEASLSPITICHALDHAGPFF